MEAERQNQLAARLADYAELNRLYGGIFDYDAKAERLQVVNAELEDPSVWNDPKHAQDLGREKPWKTWWKR